MKVAIVADWLDRYAGSERVLSSISKAFTVSEAHALVNLMSDDDLLKTFNKQRIQVGTSWLQFLGRHFRLFFPLFFIAIKNIKVSNDVDLIISSSHAVAKSVIKPSNSFHVCYFQARNMKYIWEEKALYFGGFKRIALPVLPILRRLDVKASKNPDLIIVNSKFVQSWVKSRYNRDSLVVYPPVNVEQFGIGSHDGGYFVTVGRLEPYKRFDLLVEAFNKNGLKLIVIGDGSQRKELQSNSSSNIEFVGYCDTSVINDYLGMARCFVYAGVEDFGISVVEAQATGCPVVCLNKAGTAETVLDGVTGVLFEEQTEESLNGAVAKFLDQEKMFDYFEIIKHSQNFSESVFIDRFTSLVMSEYLVFRECKL